ncbi:recombinase family protein [Kitasatospora sp. NPDC096140]|uniref:recombinase family protein n=1 Tax=Kitasatospora sp. NPDC096140 TaxID=3155425 RepID=UPI00331E16B2
MAAKSLTRRQTLRAIIYIRVSTAREDMISPELQEHTCRKFAIGEGMNVIDVVPDLDLSGGDFAKRRIGEIIARIASGEADVVLVYRWDRFGRNLEQSLINLSTLEGVGGTAKSATENFDTKTAAGRFARNNMLGLADLQREQIGEGWQRTLARRLRNGLPHNGHPRFGYRLCATCKPPKPRAANGHRRAREDIETCDDCRSGIQIPDPEYGPALTDAYERYVSGMSLGKICDEMREQGLTTYAGHAMEIHRLQGIMDTGFAAGYIRVRSESSSYQEEPPESALEPTGVGKLDRFVFVQGAHDAIISQETWEKYLEKRQAGRHSKRDGKAKYPASGLVFCGDCKHPAPMRAGLSGGSRQPVWRCQGIQLRSCNHSNAHRETLDAVIFAWINERASGEETARATAQAAVDAAREEPDESWRWEAEIQKLKKQRKNLIRMAASEDITREDFLEQRDDVDTELAKAEAQLARCGRVKANPRPPREVFEGLAQEWPTMADHLKQTALRSVVGKIIVQRGPLRDPHRYTIIPRWEMTEAA